jgi:glucuronyl/N-acetylglucosaminyl transferase EXT2
MVVIVISILIVVTALNCFVSYPRKNWIQDEEVTLSELRNARDLLAQAKHHILAPLRNIDKEKFTVRINTWHRNAQLIAAVNHYLTCPNVAQVQIVWCDQSNDPPDQLLHEMTRKNVIVERHEINSLNERFRILPVTRNVMPTVGILSVDDDVLRSCEAMDAGFYRWTDHPDRIVGYDFRVHLISTDRNNQRLDTNPIWTYGYLSSAQKSNRYSMTLPRFCFIHRDYLDLYIKFAPDRLIQTVQNVLNCEDIAMGFFVSALTNGKVPLLADFWATTPSMIKFDSNQAISENKHHKQIRDDCVDKFGFLLGLKDGFRALGNEENWGVLESNPIMYDKYSLFGIGVDADSILQESRDDFVDSRKNHTMLLSEWNNLNTNKVGKERFPFENAKTSLYRRMATLGLIK